MTSRLPLLLLAAAVGDPAATPADAPWEALEAAREALARAPVAADFEQTFVPAGFSSGEQESGVVLLAPPDRFRWDYREPYPRSYLVVDDRAYAWNAGEPSGRRTLLGEEELGHLRLLGLTVGELRKRYDARITEASGAIVTVVLSAREPDSRLTEARISILAEDSRLAAVAYEDVEGNLTRFEISGHRPVSDPGAFEPPASIEWLLD